MNCARSLAEVSYTSRVSFERCSSMSRAKPWQALAIVAVQATPGCHAALVAASGEPNPYIKNTCLIEPNHVGSESVLTMPQIVTSIPNQHATGLTYDHEDLYCWSGQGLTEFSKIENLQIGAWSTKPLVKTNQIKTTIVKDEAMVKRSRRVHAQDVTECAMWTGRVASRIATCSEVSRCTGTFASIWLDIAGNILPAGFES